MSQNDFKVEDKMSQRYYRIEDRMAQKYSRMEYGMSQISRVMDRILKSRAGQQFLSSFCLKSN